MSPAIIIANKVVAEKPMLVLTLELTEFLGAPVSLVDEPCCLFFDKEFT